MLHQKMKSCSNGLTCLNWGIQL